MLRNRVLRVGKVHIWPSPPCYVVDLLILRNRVLVFETFKYGSAVLEVGRFADIHEFCFQAAKRSDMECVVLQGCLFADRQECHFRLRSVQIKAEPSCKRVD